MFWDKGKKQQTPQQETYENKKYLQDYDWIDYYRPNRKKGGSGWGYTPGGEGSRRHIFYRVAVVLSILVLLVAVRQFNHPLGEDARSGLRYVLTTDWNVRPAMEKAVKYGLQMAGVDHQMDSGLPQNGTLKEAVSQPQTATAKGMLIPVSGKVVREYGWNKDSLDGMDRFHPGIDIAVNPGTPVKAALPGKVIKVGSDNQYGRYVLINHGEGVYTLYAGIATVKVSEGQSVKAGDSLGDIAKAGDVKSGGLHFELRENSSLIDPLTRLELPSVR